jgi:RNA polymerase sigma-70 factor (ECF subfamily)
MDNLEELLKKAQEDDKEAYGKIYGLFYERIYKYCRFNCYNQETAIDICQDTFIKAWQALPRFDTSKGTFQAFLYRIAKNLIIDNSRKKKEESINNYEHLETKEDFASDIDKKTDVSKLKGAIEKLNQKDKQIIVLHYFEELPGADIAKIIGIRKGALRVRTHRIIKKLQEIMGEQI